MRIEISVNESYFAAVQDESFGPYKYTLMFLDDRDMVENIIHVDRLCFSTGGNEVHLDEVVSGAEFQGELFAEIDGRNQIWLWSLFLPAKFRCVGYFTVDSITLDEGVQKEKDRQAENKERQTQRRKEEWEIKRAELNEQTT